MLLGGLVELDRAVHHAVVGQPDGRLVVGRGALGELVDVARAVEQRVLGVDVEVRDGRGAHGEGTIGVAADATRRLAARPHRAAIRMPRMSIYDVAGRAARGQRVRDLHGPRRLGASAARRGRRRSRRTRPGRRWTSCSTRPGARIAALCGAEAARVVPGASAGIALAVGACIARGDGARRWRRCRASTRSC